MWAGFSLALGFCVLLGSSALSAPKDNQNQKKNISIVTAPKSRKNPTNEKQIWTMTRDIDEIKKDVDSFNDRINIVFAFIGILLTATTIASLVGWVKYEMREQDSYLRAKTAATTEISYLEKVRGREDWMFGQFFDSYNRKQSEEAELREKENTIFDSSQKTLTLVNETLELAKQATERASQALKNRLEESLKNLEKLSRKTIEDSKAFRDDKSLTTDPEIVSRIHSLASKIEGLENNLVILENSTLSLSPYCRFILATEAYLKEQLTSAIDIWEEIVVDSQSEQKLTSLASFWIGYLNNNLGNFQDAEDSFENARKNSDGSRVFELRRIKLESRFFDKDASVNIANDLQKLSQDAANYSGEEDIHTIMDRKNKIDATLGNLYYRLAMKKGGVSGDRRNYLGKSRSIFAKLLDIQEEYGNVFEQINRFDNKRKNSLKWSIFGYAESAYQLDSSNEDIKKIFRDILDHLADNEFFSREEKRTKVLAKSTQLICAIRSGRDEFKIGNTKSQVESTLGGINPRLTIYSQLQRRNVDQETFRQDLDLLMSQI